MGLSRRLHLLFVCCLATLLMTASAAFAQPDPGGDGNPSGLGGQGAAPAAPVAPAAPPSTGPAAGTPGVVENDKPTDKQADAPANKFADLSIEEIAKQGYIGPKAAEKKHLAMIAKVAPRVAGTGWTVEAVKKDDLKDKVVVVIFWAAFKPETIDEAAKLNALAGRLKGKPVMVLGLGCGRGSEKFADLAKEKSITYNTARADPSILAPWKVDSYPIISVIDQNNFVRGQYVSVEAAEALVDKMLASPPSKPEPKTPAVPPAGKGPTRGGGGGGGAAGGGGGGGAAGSGGGGGFGAGGPPPP